jgi:hypothetical protein
MVEFVILMVVTTTLSFSSFKTLQTFFLPVDRPSFVTTNPDVSTVSVGLVNVLEDEWTEGRY